MANGFAQGRFAVVAVVLLSVSCGGSGSPGTSDGTGLASKGAARSCEDLAGLRLSGTTISSAASITPPFTSPANGLGAPTTVTIPFCRVVGVSVPSRDSNIGFELWLPPAGGWNGRLLASGDLGFSGAPNFPGMLVALTRGFAALGNDLGHRSTAFDASWALGHPEKVTDYGWRADHVVIAAAKEIVSAFYGRKAARSYFTGCSHGGGSALSEAQKFPEDYDGIIAGAFGNWWTNVQAAYVWEALATLGDAASFLPPSKLPMITAAAVAACDALDGVSDGLINDPRACHFDPHALLCSGADAPSCLTAAQVTAVEKIYQGPRNPRTGEQIFPGLERGSEFGWAPLIAGPQPFLGGDFFRYFVFENPTWDFHTIDFDRDVAFANAKLGSAINAISPDLRAFEGRGGKLILYQGWADPLINPRNAIDYFESVVSANRHGNGDGRGALERTRKFTRLFIAPGMTHCAGGPGPNTFGETNFSGASQPASPQLDAAHDLVSAIERWVEEDKAPDQMIATKYTNDQPSQGIAMQRPLCPYPAEAQWTGHGSTNDAANFRCVEAHGHDRD